MDTDTLADMLIPVDAATPGDVLIPADGATLAGEATTGAAITAGAATMVDTATMVVGASASGSTAHLTGMRPGTTTSRTTAIPTATTMRGVIGILQPLVATRALTDTGISAVTTELLAQPASRHPARGRR